MHSSNARRTSPWPNGAFSYPLPVKNYNDLRKSTLYVPRILIVVHVPSDPAEWIVSDPDKMVVKRCAYWVSLAGAEAITNTSTVSVTIKTEHVFDPNALRDNLKMPGSLL